MRRTGRPRARFSGAACAHGRGAEITSRYPTCVNQVTGAPSPAYRYGSSSASQAVPRTLSSAWASASGPRAVAISARSRSSPAIRSPLALIDEENSPRFGTSMKRCPSTPGLGSSVTSYRIIGHWRSAAASSAPVPGRPDQLHSARCAPGSTGWTDHWRFTGAERTRAIAHSTCGHTASGVEWTYTTPRVGTADLPVLAGASFPSTYRHPATTPMTDVHDARVTQGTPAIRRNPPERVAAGAHAPLR